VELITAVEAEQRGDASSVRGSAYLASATLLVKDIDTTPQLFFENGIRFESLAGGALRVDPVYTSGAKLYFK